MYMYRAKKIKMKHGTNLNDGLTEIDEIYLSGSGTEQFYKKEFIHDYLIDNPGAIIVDISPYPEVIPVTSCNDEKYVRSCKNNFTRDNLLELPRV